MKLIVNLIINKIIRNQEEFKETIKNIETFINHIDELYIYNITNQNLTELYEGLGKYDHIQYTDMNDYGEVKNYSIILDKNKKENIESDVSFILLRYLKIESSA